MVNATSTTADARVGFTITETLVTPESDSSLTAYATGSSNYAAKGANRLKIELTLSSLAEGSTADSSFIEIVRVKNGEIGELILATNATMEGQITALFIADSCKDNKLKISKLKFD